MKIRVGPYTQQVSPYYLEAPTPAVNTVLPVNCCMENWQDANWAAFKEIEKSTLGNPTEFSRSYVSSGVPYSDSLNETATSLDLTLRHQFRYQAVTSDTMNISGTVTASHASPSGQTFSQIQVFVNFTEVFSDIDEFSQNTSITFDEDIALPASVLPTVPVSVILRGSTDGQTASDVTVTMSLTLSRG